MITDNDTKKQIETTAEAYQFFFSGDINNSEGIVINAENDKKNKASFRISKGAGASNSYRFSSYNNGITLSNFLNNINGKKYKSGDIIKIIRKNEIFQIYLITENSKEYESLKSLLINRENTSIILDSPSTQTPQQTIYYGVPGSGKSYRIDEITKNLSEEQKIRVVFHPEYTNTDFVGQILPCLNQTTGNIEYKFSPGPFAQILRRAYLNPSKKYVLVIEEINRGNAASIFGDLFQLLDRIDKGSKDSIGNNIYEEGWSSYFINNDYINWYIREFADSSQYQDVENCVTIPNDNKSKEKNYEKYSIVNIGQITFVSNTGIRLPPNLSLLATMNTSDQNVFTLDNAFQRRWDMELVPNSCDDKTQMDASISVKGKTITWKSFQSKINEVIAEKGNESGFSSMEDKRLGCWFIKNDENKIDTEKFANKVLKYLWDDAFKFNRSEIFIDEVKNFEELKNLFIGDKGFEIFKDINFDFEPQNLEENQES